MFLRTGCAVVTWSSGVSCRHNGGSTDHFSWRRTYRDVDGALLCGRGLLSRWSCLNVNRLSSMWSLLHRQLLCILAAAGEKDNTQSDLTSIWCTADYQLIRHSLYQRPFHAVGKTHGCLIITSSEGPDVT